MSGCHVPLAMGNTSYAPSYGGYCACPCHNGLIPWNSYQCHCSCNQYRQFVGGQPSVIYLETKVMEDRIKNIETRLKELEEWTRKGEDVIHDKLKYLQEWTLKHQAEGESYGEDFEKRDMELESRLKNLEESYQGLAAELRYLLDKISNKENKKPYKCPVCDGLGGTKISGVIDQECHPCTGRGIVWG